jgi:hypothetical protein
MTTAPRCSGGPSDRLDPGGTRDGDLMSVELYRPSRPFHPHRMPRVVDLRARLLLALTVGLAVSQVDPSLLGVLAAALLLDRSE